MSFSSRVYAAAVVAILSGALIAPASAQTPSDLGDLVGARGSSGETQMQARGYAFVKTTTVRDAKWSYWWSRDQGQCVQIATSDGRYSAINLVPAPNCGQQQAGRRDDRQPDYGRSGGGERSLTLICYGEGQKPGVESNNGYQWDSKSKRFEPTYGVRSSREGFDSAVQVEVQGDQGRIHLTGKLVAPLHSGDIDNWWTLNNLRVDGKQITGSYRMNGLNSPKVVIDRRSGRINIDGIEHFRGDCNSGDWNSSRRF
jgi:hypothetical protein